MVADLGRQAVALMENPKAALTAGRKEILLVALSAKLWACESVASKEKTVGVESVALRG